MLKRHQVLLEDWQVEYMQTIAESYGISLSEALRMLVSMGTLNIVGMVNPEYKMGVSLKEVEQGIRRFGATAAKRENKYKDLSQLYFEARKAAEYRMTKIRPKNK